MTLLNLDLASLEDDLPQAFNVLSIIASILVVD
jgi:hypothetical protein